MIVPILLSVAAITVYVGFAIAALVSIWRAPRMLWWMPMAWTVVVFVAPILGAAAWFLIGERVNDRIRQSIHS